MENVLSCTLCLNSFNSSNRIPRILRCGHTFCSKCIETLANSSSISMSHFISCPYDKSLGHPSLDITEIPINRILIDLIDYSGINISSLSLSTTSSFLNQSNSYLSSAHDKLIYLKDKYTTQYDQLYSLMNLLLNEKVQLVKALNQQYDTIINILINEKTSSIMKIEKYINSRVESYEAISKIIERNRSLTCNGLNKIKTLQMQTIKPISLTDELDFINQLNINLIDNKETNDSYKNIQYKIENDLIFPKLYIKNESMSYSLLI